MFIPAEDIVPKTPWTIQALDDLNARVGTEIAMRTPGEPIYNPDGSFLAFGDPTVETGTLAEPVLTIREVAHLMPIDQARNRWPNIHLADYEGAN